MSTQSSEEAFNEHIEELKASYAKNRRSINALLMNPEEAGHSVVLHLDKVTSPQAIIDNVLRGDADGMVAVMVGFVREIIRRIGEIRVESSATTLVSPRCRGCNTVYVLYDEGQYLAGLDEERKIKWIGTDDTRLQGLIHAGITFMQLISKLIGCSSPLLSPEGCNALERSLLVDEPSQRICEYFEGELTVEDLKHQPVLLSVKLLRECSFFVPVLTRTAAAFLSIMMSRRPATILACIGDPEEFCDALFQYIVELSANVCNAEDLVTERCGVAALLHIVPALYHLSDWADARTAIDDKGLPHVLGTLCVNIIHSATQSLTCESDSCSCHMKDCPVDYAQFPQLMDCINLAERCYGNVELVNRHPESVVAVAILEVLSNGRGMGSKWQPHLLLISTTRPLGLRTRSKRMFLA